MPTIRDAFLTALEVERAGNAAPSLKFALWAASLSGQKKLQYNAAQAAMLRPYIDAELPQDKMEVRKLIARGMRMVTTANAVTVLYIEWLDNTGQLAPFYDMPATYVEWLEWRDRLYKLFRGHGLSYKMLSFAALLMWPTHCQLVPVDVWVCRRLDRDADYRRVSKNLTRYLEIERLVKGEWEGAGQPYTLGVWHWYMWEMARGSARCESHAGLSPYARSLSLRVA